MSQATATAAPMVPPQIHLQGHLTGREDEGLERDDDDDDEGPPEARHGVDGPRQQARGLRCSYPVRP